MPEQRGARFLPLLEYQQHQENQGYLNEKLRMQAEAHQLQQMREAIDLRHQLVTQAAETRKMQLAAEHDAEVERQSTAAIQELFGIDQSKPDAREKAAGILAKRPKAPQAKEWPHVWKAWEDGVSTAEKARETQAMEQTKEDARKAAAQAAQTAKEGAASTAQTGRETLESMREKKAAVTSLHQQNLALLSIAEQKLAKLPPTTMGDARTAVEKEVTDARSNLAETAGALRGFAGLPTKPSVVAPAAPPAAPAAPAADATSGTTDFMAPDIPPVATPAPSAAAAAPAAAPSKADDYLNKLFPAQ